MPARKGPSVRAAAVLAGTVSLLFGTVALRGCAGSSLAADILARQRAQFDADAPKTILDLQPFRTETRVPISATSGAEGTATLST